MNRWSGWKIAAFGLVLPALVIAVFIVRDLLRPDSVAAPPKAPIATAEPAAVSDPPSAPIPVGAPTVVAPRLSAEVVPLLEPQQGQDRAEAGPSRRAVLFGEPPGPERMQTHLRDLSRRVINLDRELAKRTPRPFGGD